MGVVAPRRAREAATIEPKSRPPGPCAPISHNTSTAHPQHSHGTVTAQSQHSQDYLGLVRGRAVAEDGAQCLERHAADIVRAVHQQLGERLARA